MTDPSRVTMSRQATQTHRADRSSWAKTRRPRQWSADDDVIVREQLARELGAAGSLPLQAQSVDMLHGKLSRCGAERQVIRVGSLGSGTFRYIASRHQT